MTEAEKKLHERIMRRYESARNAKLTQKERWKVCQDYWAGDVNLPETEDDPGSETNIVQANIESQVADLVDGQMEPLLKGVGPSDQEYAGVASQIFKYIWRRNKMIPKLDEGERNRLNLGTVVWKVYWDENNGMYGLPVIEPYGPDSFFPDPKIKHPRKINDGDFCIHVLPYTTSQIRREFKESKYVKAVTPDGVDSDAQAFDEEFGADEVARDVVQLIEYWEKDDDGKLRRVFATKDYILEDSFDSEDEENEPSSFYKHSKYPFVVGVCYLKPGSLWGLSDTEQMIPLQDVINELDDQVRMNARQTANAQTVVAKSSGININKWTPTPGLKIPAHDVNGWKQVTPQSIPAYVLARRDRAFSEVELVTGRSDVVEGRRSGSLRAAAAILALQEAGNRRANHKKLMNEQTFNEIADLVIEYAKEFMTTEQAFDITENGQVQYLWAKASDLDNIPILTYNENWNPVDPEAKATTNRYKPLLDPETGNVMTKSAEFDIEITFGAGMPNNKSFIYQAAVELFREGMITQEEARKVITEMLNWAIIDPMAPVGNFAGRNLGSDQLALVNGQPPSPETGQVVGPGQSAGGEAPMIDSSQNIEQILAMMPPEQIIALMQQLGAMQGGDPNVGYLGQ